MAYAMTKRGSQDNVITYEFICDTLEDMNAIENKYRTLGTIAIVLGDGLEVYIAGSNKEWNSLSTINSGDASGAGGGLSIYICGQNEVSNGVPDVSDPDETTIYLVASGNTSGNLYEEYIYVDGAWEKFGAASIDLSNYATKSEIPDVSGFYTKPSGGIPAADLADTYLTSHQDISGLAPKANPEFTDSISLGRAANSTIGNNSVAVGGDVVASNWYTHAEGCETSATGLYAHSEGQYSEAIGPYSHAEGSSGRAEGTASHFEGYGGNFLLRGVQYTAAAKGNSDHVEGYQCLTVSGQPGNHAEGYQSQATGGAAHAEGCFTVASGPVGSHAEGSSTVASGTSSHAEGLRTTASEAGAHAEGADTIASGVQAHAEGMETIAHGGYSHAEGAYTIASGVYSHVSGIYNIEDSYSNWTEWVASTSYSIGDKVKVTTTENNNTIVRGYICKTANSDVEFDTSKWTYLNGQMNYAEIIGNGTDENARSNARALDWEGNEYLKGDLYVECIANSTGGSKVATEDFVTARVPAPPVADGTYNLQVTVSSGTATYSWVAAPGTASGVSF